MSYYSTFFCTVINARNLLLQILKPDKISGGQFALVSPTPIQGRRVSPSPWFTPMNMHNFKCSNLGIAIFFAISACAHLVGLPGTSPTLGCSCAESRRHWLIEHRSSSANIEVCLIQFQTLPVPAMTGNVTSAGWQVTLCDPQWRN